MIIRIHPRKVIRITKEYLRHALSFYLVSDKRCLSKLYKQTFGREIDWNNPQSFNEKLNWLKLHDRNPKYHILVDKLRVKPIVAELIGAEYVIPAIGGGIRGYRTFQKTYCRIGL